MDTELQELRRFVEFVNLWIYRDCSANEEERLSVIKYHPTARKAARAANWFKDPVSSSPPEKT